MKPIPATDDPRYEAGPPRRQANRGGCGCWLPALLTLFVAAVLVVVGLFLPPVDLWNKLFGVQYATLNQDANAIAVEGLTVAVDPADSGQNFGVAVEPMPIAAYLNGSSDAAWVAAARAANPPQLALESQVYTIDTSGTAPQSVTLDLQVPADTGSADLLSLYGWNSQRGSWQFVPSQRSSSGSFVATVEDIPQQVALFQVAPPPQPTVLVPVDVVQTLTDEVSQLATIVAPAGLQPTIEGTLAGSLAAGFDLNSAYLVAPDIRNFSDPRALDTDTIGTILGNSSLRHEHATQLAAFASTGFDGLVIDYREISPDQRDQYAAFIRDLGAQMDDLGLFLVVVVPEPTN